MGTIPLPLPWYDEHRAGHPPALLGGRDPKDCPFCKVAALDTEGAADNPLGRVTGEDLRAKAEAVGELWSSQDSGSGETVAGSTVSDQPRSDRQADTESTDSPRSALDTEGAE